MKSKNNIVEVSENHKSPLHNNSLQHQGKVIDTNEYNEYLLGGIKSFSKDSFFFFVVANRNVAKNLETQMKKKNSDFVVEGVDSGTIHIVNWNREEGCFLVWKHILKDSLINLGMESGGVFESSQGQIFDSVVNYKFLKFNEDLMKSKNKEMK